MKDRNSAGVVIIGAGFAGLWAMKTLAGNGLTVTLVDRNNYHTFLPLLYQVAAAEIEPEQIAYPVRTLLRGRKGCRFIRAEVSVVDHGGKYVVCNGRKIHYEYLVMAPGSVTDHYGVPGAARHTFGLKTLDDAMILRNHILSCYERASYEDDPVERRRLLSLMIIGGGATGVEFAGALAELVRGPLGRDFPGLVGAGSLYLVEAGNRLLPMFNERSSTYALKTLRSLGVEVLFDSPVREVLPGGAVIGNGKTIEARSVIWTAGVAGCVPGRGQGRVSVDDTLLMEGTDSVYIAGDLTGPIRQEAPLPMVATVAIQQGRAVARNILQRVRGKEPRPFRFRDKGTMATIGRNAAITRLMGRELRGFAAWVIWLSVHIMYLIGFRNKLLVMINWIWAYLFFEKSVRLILPRCCDSPGAAACAMRERGEECGQ